MGVINNSASNTIVTGTSGNDTIYNSPSQVTINAGAGDDSIYSRNYAFMNGDAGNDTITANYGGSINGGAGNDLINFNGYRGAVNGGTGNDTVISTATKGVLYRYASGDGDDVIFGFNSNDTLQITEGTYQTLISGDDFIVKVGNSSIVLKDVAADAWAKVRIVSSSGTFVWNDWSVMNGTDGNDTLKNVQPNTTVNGNAGNDSITNYGDSVTVNGNAGNDSITNYGDSVTVDGGAGDDKITLRGGALNKVYAGAGNDYIYDNYSNTFNSIDGGSGSDTIVSYTGSVDGGAGSDLITISGPATARGGTGNDTIYGVDKIGIFSANQNKRLYQYYAGDGNDIIFGYNENSSLKIRGEAYSTQRSGSDVIITVGDGSITLAGAATLSDLHISGYKVGDPDNPWLVTLTEDADTYSNTVEDATIAALAGNDRISNTVDNVSINAGADNDTVTNSGKNVTITTGAGNDSVRNYSSDSANISTGDGNDTVYNGAYGESATINTGNGNDFVYNGLYSSASKISLGAGNDTLVSDWGALLTISGGKGDDSIKLDVHSDRAVIEYASGDGNDTIDGFNPTDTLSLTGGAITGSVISGDDLILKVGTGSITLLNTRTVNVDGTILNPTSNEGTSAHDFLTNFDDNATMNGYGDSDKLGNTGNNVLINTGEGDNSVGNYGDRATIVTGDGNNTIYNDGMSSKIVAGSGNDSIHNGWTSATIDAGDGDDTIINNYISSLSGGDGNDVIIDDYGHYGSTINGGKGDDTIHAYSDWDGTTTFEYSDGDGNDVIYSFGKTDTLIIGNGTTDTYSRTTVGNDIIVQVGEGNITLKGAAYLPSVNIAGTKKAPVTPVNPKLIRLSERADTYENTLEGATIQALSGNDTVINYAAKVSVDGGAGDDVIGNAGSNVTLGGGEGNDWIENWDGNNVLIDGGNGNDLLLNNYNSDNGKNLTINGGAGDDSIQNMHDSVTVNAGDDNDLIENYAETFSVNGGKGSDTVRNYGDNTTITGGADNDLISLQSASKNNRIQYASGDGNDTISGFNATDTLIIGGGTGTYSTQVSGSDIIVTVGEGSIVLKGAASLSSVNISGKESIKPIDPDDPKLITLTEDADTYSNTVQGATILALGGNDRVTNKAADVSISGGDGDDRVTLSGTGSTVDAGDDNDAVINSSASVSIDGGNGDDSIDSMGLYSTLVGGDGNDSIRNKTGNGTILAGAGNDSIVAMGTNYIDAGADDDEVTVFAGGRNSTVLSGAGDDSINNIADNVTFIHKAGDGSDTISGFRANSTLLTDGEASFQTVGNDVVVSIGDDSILLKGAASLSSVNVDNEGNGDAYLRLDGTQAIYGTGDEVIFTIYGIGAGAKLSDFVISGKTVTISKGALDKGELFLDSDEYTLKFASDVPTSATKVNASWSALTDGKATFTAAALSDYYTLEDNSVTYNEGEGGESFTLTGIKSIAATAVEVDEDTKTVTVNAAALGNDNVTFDSEDFTLTLGDDVAQDPGDGDAKFISFDAGTAVYEVTSGNAYYTLDGNEISFTSAGSTTQFTISGLADNLMLVNGTLGGVEVLRDGDEVKFILSTYALKNSNVTVTGTGATLELGDDVLQSAETIDGAWSEVTGGKATYSTNGKTKYYTLSGNQIVYHAAVDGDIEIELAGLASTVTSEDGAIDELSVNENALTVSGNIVDGNLVVVRNEKNLSIDIGGDVENISVTGTDDADNFNVAGKNVTVIGSDGDDVVDMQGSGVIQYASGDGNDTLNHSDEYTIKITSGTVGKATVDGDDVIIPVDKGSLTIKDGRAQPINLVDAKGNATVLVVDDPIGRFLTYNDDETAVTVEAGFNAGTIGAGDYSSTVKTIVSSAVEEPIELFGNDKANLIIANDNANTIHGGKGADTIHGGQILSGDAGNDVFVYSQGDVTITDYSTGDKVSLDGAQISDVHISGDDIVLSFGDENSLTIQDASTKKITFVNDKTATQYLFADGAIFNSGKTTATLTASASKFNAGSYTSLATIDGSNVDGQLQIVGNAKANKIFAGNGGSTLNGGKGNDTLTGGDGADVFVYENKSGNDVIANFGADDKISLGAGASISSFKFNAKGDVTFKVGSNNLTVKDVEGQTLTFVDAAGNETSATYDTDKVIQGDGTTLTSAFKEKTFTAPTGTKIVDASDVSKSFALNGNDSDNVLIGGNGVQTLRGGDGNDTLTGGKGNDVFIYERGDDTITDYATGDKISLTSAVNSFRTDGDDVIIDFAEGSLTIQDAAGKKVTLIENGKSSVNIFAAGGILNTAGTAITLAASTQTYTADSKVTTIDGSNVNGQLQIVGNTKANKIFAGNGGSTLSGGKGTDTLTGGNGSDVFVYENKSGNKVIQSFGAGDKISISGATVTDIYTSGDKTIVKVGSNSITVKGAADVSLVDDDGEKNFRNGLLYGANGSVTVPASFKQKTTTPLELSAALVDASADKYPLNMKSTSTTGASIHGGTKNDTLTGSAKNDTLYGGKGTDSLWGGGGADTFVYEKGDGKDFIFGFGNDDLLEIVGMGQKVTGTFNKAGDTFTVKAGATTVAVLKDFSATTFNVTADGTSHQFKK